MKELLLTKLDSLVEFILSEELPSFPACSFSRTVTLRTRSRQSVSSNRGNLTIDIGEPAVQRRWGIY